MPVRMFETGSLFGVALDAARSIKASSRQGGQREALVSIVFSVVALEAFINEVTELALDDSKNSRSLEPRVVSVLAELMADAERSHLRLESKFALASWVLTGKRLDRGAQPYQDFALLLRLRNDLVHFEPNASFEQGQTPEEIHKQLFDKFGGKNILADSTGVGLLPWSYYIQTKAVAQWACKAAAGMVTNFSTSVPESGFKVTVEFLGRSFAQNLGID